MVFDQFSLTKRFEKPIIILSRRVAAILNLLWVAGFKSAQGCAEASEDDNVRLFVFYA